MVFVWDACTAEKLGSFRLPRGTRAVNAIAFNRDGRFIACADFSNNNNMYLYEWRSGTQKWAKQTGGNKIFMIDWNRAQDTFMSVGPKHVFFWDMAGNKKGGIFGSDQMTNLLCVTHDDNGVAYTGA